MQFTEPVFDRVINPAVDRLRDRTDELFAGTGLEAGYTGDAAAQRDAAAQEGVVALVSSAVIVLLMLLIFRSPLIAVLNLALVTAVGVAGGGLLIGSAEIAGFSLDSGIKGLLPIVVLGVGTDYAIFVLFRYRERLRLGEDRHTAMAQAIGHVGAAVTSSAFAVVVSFGALLLSAYEGFRVLGPALAFAVLLTLLAGLTLIPAVMVLVRPRALFWFSRSYQHEPRARLGRRLGAMMSRRPAALALASAAVLVGLGVAALAYAPSYELNSVPRGTESARALETLKTGFPTGTLNPTEVFVERRDGAPVAPASLEGLERTLAGEPGVGRVLAPQFSADRRIARIDLLLAEEPFSGAALDLVAGRVIPAAHRAAPPGTVVTVGGNTAAFADIRTVMNEDMRVIFPVAAVLIGIVLILMLRSLLAPLYMLGAVVLGFAATLGAAVIVFQGIGGERGLTFTLPMIVYLFVASMGGDYNILMISRIREELSGGASGREAAALALRGTGPAVGAAGVILAASFASLIFNSSLAQTGFAVALGIFLSAFVMAGLLVPAITALLGRRAFWPAVPFVGPGRRATASPAPAGGVTTGE